MINIINFTNCNLSNRNLQYAGRAGEKRGIIYNNEHWLLKFPKNTIGMNNVKGLSYVTSPLSEYIASNIFKILGFVVHETILGVFFDGKKNKVVCACKDFIKDDKNELLIPYTALRNDTDPLIMERNDDKIQSASNLNEILFQLKHNTVLSKIPECEKRFWQAVIVDILVNNNDRNEDNWGVIKYKEENSYILAPIYDCGNSFYGKTSDERIDMIMQDNERLISSAINGITAYEDDKESRISITQMLEIVKENSPVVLNEMVQIIKENMSRIKNLIDEIPTSYGDIIIMSEARKEYYYKTMEIRLNLMENILFNEK